jgi:tol-pal system protein YbgF
VRTAAFVLFVVTLPALWGSGCATQTDLQNVQRDRDALRTQLADAKASVDNMRREIEGVRGEVEELRYRLDRVARNQPGSSPQLKILQDRIEILEKQLAARPPESPPASGLPSDTPSLTPPGDAARPLPGEPPPLAPGQPQANLPPGTGARPTAPGGGGVGLDDPDLAKEPLEAQDEYKLALQALRGQQYDQAVQQFRLFQRKYPTSAMADDAQYWIGESYFTQKDYNRAILEFNDVLRYRRGNRVPAALLRQAQAFLEIGDRTDARLILQKVINDHPNSEQAREAKELLPTLGR